MASRWGTRADAVVLDDAAHGRDTFHPEPDIVVDLQFQSGQIGSTHFEPCLRSGDRSLTLVEQWYGQRKRRTRQLAAIGFALAFDAEVDVAEQAPALDHTQGVFEQIHLPACGEKIESILARQRLQLSSASSTSTGAASGTSRRQPKPDLRTVPFAC